MSGADGADPGPAQSNTQNNAGNNVYASLGGDINIHQPPAAARRGLGTDTKVLLTIFVADVAFFFIGMLSYTGTNTGGDTWRAGIFLFLLAVTGVLVRRWIRRRGIARPRGGGGAPPAGVITR